MFVAEDITAKLCAHVAAIQHPEATTLKRRKILFETFPTPQNGGKNAMLALGAQIKSFVHIYIYIISMAILTIGSLRILPEMVKPCKTSIIQIKSRQRSSVDGKKHITWIDNIGINGIVIFRISDGERFIHQREV